MIKAKGRARLGDRGGPSAGASEAHNDFWCGMLREHAGGDAKLLIKFAWPYRTTHVCSRGLSSVGP